MPSYRFKCTNPECGHVFDEFYFRTDFCPESSACPLCEHDAKKQITGGSGFVLKGSGWTPKSRKSRRG